MASVCVSVSPSRLDALLNMAFSARRSVFSAQRVALCVALCAALCCTRQSCAAHGTAVLLGAFHCAAVVANYAVVLLCYSLSLSRSLSVLTVVPTSTLRRTLRQATRPPAPRRRPCPSSRPCFVECGGGARLLLGCLASCSAALASCLAGKVGGGRRWLWLHAAVQSRSLAANPSAGTIATVYTEGETEFSPSPWERRLRPLDRRVRRTRTPQQLLLLLPAALDD